MHKQRLSSFALNGLNGANILPLRKTAELQKYECRKLRKPSETEKLACNLVWSIERFCHEFMRFLKVCAAGGGRDISDAATMALIKNRSTFSSAS